MSVSGHSKNIPFIRVVLLKQIPKTPSIQKSYDASEELSQKIGIKDKLKKFKTNHTSIAYLSSLLQDRNSTSKDSYAKQDQIDVVPTFLSQPEHLEIQEKRFKRIYAKHEAHHLSAIIQRDQKQHQRYFRAKTESIDKLIAKRKIMPIDMLKIGRKNIRFSTKNKIELSDDFIQFVSSKSGVVEAEPDQVKENKNTIHLFRRGEQAKRTKAITHSINSSKLYRQRKSVDICSSSLESPPKYVEIQQKGGLASYLKKIKNGMPTIKNFRWSKVSNEAFTLETN